MATCSAPRIDNAIEDRNDRDRNAGDKFDVGVDLQLRLRETESRYTDGDATEDGLRSIASGEIVEYRTYRRRWFGLVQLTLLNVIVSWDWLTFAPVASSAAAYYATSESAINWLSTAFLFAFVAVSPLTLRVLHHGPKSSIAVAAALVLVGNWVRYGGSHSSEPGSGIYGVVMFGQILCGLAQPFVLAAPTRYSDLWFSSRGRVAATAAMSLANPFGAALGQLIVPFWVEEAGDMSRGVLYVAVISSVCALPAFFIPAAPPTPVAPSSQTLKPPILPSLRLAARSPEIYLLLIPFAAYVGLFNSCSSLLNQMLTPHGLSDDQAGIGGAILIVVGLLTAAATSPILDRTKAFLLALRTAVPVIALSYLVFVWMPETGGVAGPYVVLAILGAASFSLVPVALEFLIELSHPVGPEVTSVVAWAGGQLLGGCFVLISDAMQAGEDANPPSHMKGALIFQAVVALVVMPLPLCLGLFGRREKMALRRVQSDQEGARQRTEEARALRAF